MKKFRVLVFGATGVGKTSLCNALAGQIRPTDNGPLGKTSKSYAYEPFVSGDCEVEIVDTVGLHESDHGTVSADKALIELVSLLEKAKDGFSLLIHVSRASRLTKDHDEDYEYFVNRVTLRNIPVVLVVTGCENEHPMGSWVEKHNDAFKRFDYKEIIATCFSVGGPLESIYQPLRLESRQLVAAAIHRNALGEPFLLYGDGTGNTINDALTRIWNEFVRLAGLPEDMRRKTNESVYKLMIRMGVPRKLADAAIMHIPDLVGDLGEKYISFPYAGKILRKVSEVLLGRFRREQK